MVQSKNLRELFSVERYCKKNNENNCLENILCVPALQVEQVMAVAKAPDFGST